MTAVVNPDVFLAALWTAALYVMTLIVKRGSTPGRMAWLAALAIASCLTQPRGLAIVRARRWWSSGCSSWRRTPAVRTRRLAIAAVSLAIAAALTTLTYYAVGGDLSADRVRQFVSYVWQFYLPRLPFMDPSISASYGIGELFDRFVSGFGMLEAAFPPGVLRALKVTALLVAVLAVAGLIARRHELRRRLDVVAVCVAMAIGYLALLHAAAFRSLLTSSDPVITGRYLLPLLPFYGAAIALAVAWLPRRWAPVAGAVAVSSVLLLQLAAMGVLFTRFYA